jgi:membrane protease YdiL (CAAX protease family)
MSLFVFGNFFSSFSEDILTRGYVYHHLNKRISTTAIICISAAIYLLNHIYRLKDGPQAWTYLFMLGVLYVIPLLLTKRLWFTGGMHWAGNCIFYFTHEIIKADSVPNKISPNYILLFCTIVIIPIVYLLIKRLNLIPAINTLHYKREEKILVV